MSNLFRDKGRLSDRLRDKSGDDLLKSMRDEFDQDKRMFFETPSSWTESSNLNSPFTRAGFPFDSSERGARSSSRLQKHLDDIAARHPEFAEHLRPEMAYTRGGQRTRQPSGSSSGVFSSGDEDVASDTHSQTSEEAAKQPQQDAPRKLPQYGMRNTVDLGGAAQKLEQSERNQRSWSAPPEGRTVEEQPKRFVSRIEIQPQLPGQPPMQEAGGPANPGPANPGVSKPGKPPVAPKPPPRSGERVIPIFVEGRNEPVVPKGDSQPAQQERPQQPPPKMQQQQQQQFPSEAHHQGEPNMQHQFPDRHMDYEDFVDFPSFASRGFGESPFGDRFSRPEFPMPTRQQRHFGEPFWAHRPSQQQQAPPSPQQKRPMAAQSPPTKRASDKPQAAPEPPPKARPPPPVNDPLAKVANVQKDVEELMKEVDAFTGSSKKDKQYIFLDEMLTRELIKLDDIETEGKENIRQARKEAIRSIQRAISMLESKVQKTAECSTARGTETEQGDAEMQVEANSQPEAGDSATQ